MLQKSIEANFAVSIKEQPLRTFLDRFYSSTAAASGGVHRESIRAARDAITSDEVLKAKPVYSELRRQFFQGTCTLGDLKGLLEDFSIDMTDLAVVQLYIRMQWEIEADNEFTVACGDGYGSGYSELSSGF